MTSRRSTSRTHRCAFALRCPESQRRVDELRGRIQQRLQLIKAGHTNNGREQDARRSQRQVDKGRRLRGRTSDGRAQDARRSGSGQRGNRSTTRERGPATLRMYQPRQIRNHRATKGSTVHLHNQRASTVLASSAFVMTSTGSVLILILLPTKQACRLLLLRSVLLHLGPLPTKQACRLLLLRSVLLHLVPLPTKRACRFLLLLTPTKAMLLLHLVPLLKKR